MKRWMIILLLAGLVSSACVRTVLSPVMTDEEKIQATAAVLATQAVRIPARVPGAPPPTPTPDAPHKVPALRSEPDNYVAKQNDTLGLIAASHGITLAQLLEENLIDDPDSLRIGQELSIPVPVPSGQAPGFKIIPDSELIFGPTATDFNSAAFLEGRQGYLSNYSEKFDDVQIAGVEIVNRVARDYSVNPRLLLALLEYMGGWVTNPRPSSNQIMYPLGYEDPTRKGLYRQLSFAANNLNKGFYLWQANALSHFILVDGSFITPNPTVNAGTVGVQYFFSQALARPAWEKAIAEHGFITQYQLLFGYPFDLGMEPLLPRNLNQPKLQLPFEQGVSWSFTAGPHSSWGDGSAWGALDFAPPGDMLGCNTSDDWVVAAADGWITRSADGQVIQDLDEDGKEQTGWSLLYMHIETRDRVQRGTYVKAGEPIGHPSCEGGVSTGTHLHFARRYNGTWIAADASTPTEMDGWVSSGQGLEYDGALTRKDQVVEAWDGRKPDNQIQR
ncbi:MAG: LysM peptidoglycan-binding domain-containing M23 family metallopeptidase [Leptolinea sp.]